MPREYFIYLFVGGLAVWISILLYIRSSNKSVIPYFKKLGEKYGVTVDDSKKIGISRFPVAEGMYRSHPLFVGSTNKGENYKSFVHTYFRLICRNYLDLTFLIVKKNKQNIAKYGTDAVTMNDSEFDEKFLVVTNNPELMVSLLDFNIKYKLLQSANLGFNGEITLKNDNLLYIEPDLIRNDVVMLRSEVMIHVLTDIADSLKFKKEKSIN
ncbi:MAG: hypothetical protein EHM58_12430 [Ignavibacteriae bacterium]|nr:MAG: hypothetical protein EHM58_12430 [Ignavibacteriota bacterium]